MLVDLCSVTIQGAGQTDYKKPICTSYLWYRHHTFIIDCTVSSDCHNTSDSRPMTVTLGVLLMLSLQGTLHDTSYGVDL